MRKVVSIALFGRGDGYASYLPTFILAHLNLFPVAEGWRLRVHVDDEVWCNRHGDLIRRFAHHDLLDVFCMGPSILTKAMLWRAAPVFDDCELGADFVFCRDIDACPMPRDRAVCEQFMVSRAAIGTCHDNMAHAGVMGGLCHFSAPEFRRQTGFRSLDDLYRYASHSDAVWALHGSDQNVLNRLVSTTPHLTLLEHRFNGWTEGRPGPYRREPAVYGCQAWSTQTPDDGEWSCVNRELVCEADRLANHLGSAGYDYNTARRFYEAYGDPKFTAAVRECEEELK